MKWIKILVALILTLNLLGCVSWTKGEQEFGFKQETQWGFYSRAIQDDDQVQGESGISSTVVDQLLKSPKGGQSENGSDGGD